MKSALLILLGSFLSISAIASGKYLLGEIKVNGETVMIVSDEPTQGGDIKLKNVRAESQSGQSYRLTNNSRRVLDPAACENFERKNYYQTLSSAGQNELVLDLESGKVTKDNSDIVIVNVICMKNPY